MTPQRIIHFEERQYLGLNHYSLLRSLVLALFCFVAYYFTENREKNAELLFFAGILFMIISLLSMFIKHLHTRVFDNSIELDGLWTMRKVKIDLTTIKQIEKIPYSNYLLNTPVYNLHRNGSIFFYTSGRTAVRITDKDGLQYIIGTHKQEEFFRIISDLLLKQKPV
jgi:hypothetical protein